MAAGAALQVALALHQQPTRNSEARQQPLPGEVSEVLRIASGQAETLNAAVAATGISAEVLRDVARFFVEQQLLARECEGDPWRTLGVPGDASETQIKEHRRLLLGLVHPDRTTDWEPAYSDRVHRAWRQIRQSDDRPRLNGEAQTAASSGGRADGPIAESDPDGWDSVMQPRSGLDSFAAGDLPTSLIQSAPEVHARPSRPAMLLGGLAAVLVAAVIGWNLFASPWAGDEVLVSMSEETPRERVQAGQRVAMDAGSASPRVPVAADVVPALVVNDVASVSEVSDAGAVDEALGGRVEGTGLASATRNLSEPVPVPAPVPDALPFVVSAASSSTVEGEGFKTNEGSLRPTSDADHQAHRIEDRPVASMVNYRDESQDSSRSPVAEPLAERPNAVVQGTTNSSSVAAPDKDLATTPGQRPRAVSSTATLAFQDQGPEPLSVEPEPEPETTPASSAIADVLQPTKPALAANPTHGASRHDSQIRDLLGEFSVHYGSGDLTALIGLFSRRANAAKGGSMALAADYARLFSDTRERNIEISQVSWRSEDEVLRGVARFNARYHKQGRLFRQSISGDIQFAMVDEDGALKILRLDSTPSGRSR